MEYHEHPPHPDLAGLVRTYWWLSGPARAAQEPEPALPDGSPELIVNLAESWEQVAKGGTVRRQPTTFLVGQILAPMVVRPTGGIDLVAVRFEAHGASLIASDLAAITDSWVAIEGAAEEPSSDHVAAPREPRSVLELSAAASLSGVRGALERARQGGEADERSAEAGRRDGEADKRRADAARRAQVTILDELLLGLLRSSPVVDAAVAGAVAAIRGSHGAVEIEPLARRLGVTTRTLQRRFARAVGITPKQLARIVRFQRVFAAWRDDPASLSRVALECGYFDQSHLVRDFRDFAGAPPAGFLAALSDFTANFTAARARQGARG